MVSKTSEKNFEDLIEESLILKGYVKGNSSDYNKQYAVDERLFWEFLESTQSEQLEKISYKSNYKVLILDRLNKMIRTNKIVDVLHKGLKVEGAKFNLFFPYPSKNASQKEIDGFNNSIFSVTRQLYYSLENKNSIDTVIFINGIPIITMELKNEWTGQNARYDAINQYKKNRDPKEPLLEFGRCIVHFAVDTNEIYMTTKLEKEKTMFLPFNKGNNGGAGNPVNPNGHRTAYLWEEILSKKNICDIINNYVAVITNKETKKQTLYFPRYHQFDSVSKLIGDVEQNKVGQKYLIQHSAGSGKSNSITWLAYQLIEMLDDEKNQLFDSVIIVTDRRLLDDQLGRNLGQFSRQNGVVKTANSSKDLREGIESRIRIMTTTIQKFPYIVDEMSDMSNRNFAIIIDEAHSSQGGSAAGMMNQAMGDVVDDSLDYQDQILEIIKARQMKSNVSYFAFTATPKNTTLERFGTKQKDGSFIPFHLYSMKQAIEEEFILDVLSNYTTYKSYYELNESIENSEMFDNKLAQRKLKTYVENNKVTIEAKANIMIDHFIENVVAKKKLNSKGKAMIATQSIEQAIRYYQSVTKLLDERNNPFKVLIAFSGEKEVDGISYTEEQMNGMSETKTKEEFDKDEYRILIVANKYLTGFDQPKLCAMYVDKKLSGVLCVQALSRLNRSAKSLNKRTEDLFVLDFYNTIEDIRKSFEPYYTSTSLISATDVNVLHDITDIIDYVGVYTEEDVEEFSKLYFEGTDAQFLSPILDKCASNFNEFLYLSEEEKVDFKIKCKQFVKVYGQIAALIPFENEEWEKLFWFLKFLIPKLKVNTYENNVIDSILDKVDLATYALKREKIGETIKLDEEETIMDTNSSNPHAIHEKEEKVTLNEIVNIFNEKWFSGTSLADSDILIRLSKELVANEVLMSDALESKDKQNFDILFEKLVSEEMLKNKNNNIEIYKLFKQNEEFKRSILNNLETIVRNVN